MARAQKERAEQEPKQVLKVRVIHVGLDDRELLPKPQTISWRGGVTEIVHVAGSSQ
jgi:hypothetical protein